MTYTALGASGITVSRLCFGSLTVGPLQAALSVEAGASVIAHAVKRGVNFIDTAQYYRNYEYIREAMRLCGKRDIVISSKTYAVDYDDAIKAVDEARIALDRDYIDIFMLHEQESIETLRGHHRALDALFDLKAKGVIRAVGASMHRIAAVRGVIDLRRRCIYDFGVVHPLYNYKGLGIADGSADEMGEAVAEAAGLGIGVFSMKPLGGGNLINSAGDAFSFLLANQNISAVAVGMQSEAEVDANVSYFESGEFEPEAQKILSQKSRRLIIDGYCEGCGTCVKRCGQHALHLENNRAVCDRSKCILCGYCAGVCPQFAIKVI